MHMDVANSPSTTSSTKSSGSENRSAYFTDRQPFTLQIDKLLLYTLTCYTIDFQYIKIFYFVQ